MTQSCFQPHCRREVVKVVNAAPCCADHAVLRRARWQCEALIPDRLRPGTYRRCPTMGSEVSASGGEARCPRHREVRENASC